MVATPIAEASTTAVRGVHKRSATIGTALAPALLSFHEPYEYLTAVWRGGDTPGSAGPVAQGGINLILMNKDILTVFFCHFNWFLYCNLLVSKYLFNIKGDPPPTNLALNLNLIILLLA